jgi:hypothetical protein
LKVERELSQRAPTTAPSVQIKNNNQMPEKVVDYGQSDNYFGDIRLKDTDVLNESDNVIVSMKNVHKTYLLGVEGIPALRFVKTIDIEIIIIIIVETCL